MRNKQLIVIVGPTGVGKTEIAVRLAEHLGTEIVSADSRQIFAELNAGTAKPTRAQLDRVRHHLVGSHSIQDDMDAAIFGKLALELIHGILKNVDRLILCGGSGLYIQAVLKGFDPMPDIPKEIRKEIVRQYRANGIGWLQEQVREKDPAFYQQADQKNPHRLTRALEILMTTGKKMQDFRTNKSRQHPFEIVKIGLEMERKILFECIDRRADEMISGGLIEEARALFSKRHLNALQTVGYSEVFGFLDGAYDEDEMMRLLKRNTRRYAKRQLTWFKKDPEIAWFRPGQWDEIINLAMRDKAAG